MYKAESIEITINPSKPNQCDEIDTMVCLDPVVKNLDLDYYIVSRIVHARQTRVRIQIGVSNPTFPGINVNSDGPKPGQIDRTAAEMVSRVKAWPNRRADHHLLVATPIWMCMPMDEKHQYNFV